MTTVAVDEENWERLNRMKRPGESFDDVISRLLDAPHSGAPEPAQGGGRQ